MLFQGVIPVIPTPILENQEIDFAGLERLVAFCVQLNPPAMVLPAFGSEFYKLSDAERIDVIKAAVGAAGGAVPVIAQCNHPSDKVAADLAKQAEADGAAAIAVALPRGFPSHPDQLMA